MFGDELSNAKALYTAGYVRPCLLAVRPFAAATDLPPPSPPQVIGQIPSNLLLTRVNPGRWLPFCELAWTLCTRMSPLDRVRIPAPADCLVSVVGMYGVRHVNSVYLLRFFIGLFESSCVPACLPADRLPLSLT